MARKARKAKKSAPDAERTRFEEFAARKPELTVLSDEPLRLEDAHLAKFNLAARLGPVYDILRHPDTRPPLAVAVYGDWGSGKSTAMRWLEALLDQWNTQAKKGQGQVPVHSVWFEPWKYHTREDVWRGLIAEVILASINVKGATVDRVVAAAKQFGLFLGRGFLHALGSIKGKVGPAEIEPREAIQEIYKDWRQTSHPEKAFLNEFEDALRTWVRETMGKNERMVVFVDDLDRCLPQVALEVLEALKLYLNVGNLIFVVGVAQKIIEALVAQHYKELRLARKEDPNYLAKMFQVEVHVGVPYKQVHEFLDSLLDATEIWRETALTDKHREAIHETLRSLVRGNPREAKRLVNEVMIQSRAGLLGQESLPQDDDLAIVFAQALQRDLIRRILLKEFPDKVGMVYDPKEERFFRDWSKIVCGNEDKPYYIPYADVLSGVDERTGTGPSEKLPAKQGKDDTPAPLPAKYAHFNSIWSAAEHRSFRSLLKDEDLGRLMQIEYPDPERAEAFSATAPVMDLPIDEAEGIEAEIEKAERVAKSGDPRFAELGPLDNRANWVTIPAGEFLMGAQKENPSKPNYDKEAYDDEWPVHPVRLSEYRIGRYPLTVGEYARFLEVGSYREKALWSAGGFGDFDEPEGWDHQREHPARPVVGVSWFEASAYAAWAKCRLPTEAEWERAARGIHGRRYPWGDEAIDPSRANYGVNIGSPTPVGVYPKGATPEGICDLAGNVWEWCQDQWHDGYDGALADGSAWEGEDPSSRRVVRGGSWGYAPWSCRSSCRGGIEPGGRGVRFGFRVVVSLGGVD